MATGSFGTTVAKDGVGGPAPSRLCLVPSASGRDAGVGSSLSIGVVGLDVAHRGFAGAFSMLTWENPILWGLIPALSCGSSLSPVVKCC